ncbi:MAG TPA: family 78 glycoside hydrolase catalytic domain [Microbacteriaceae bacterium]
MNRDSAHDAVRVGVHIDGPIRFEQSNPSGPVPPGCAPVSFVGVPSPRLSWRIDTAPRAWRQLGSEIEASYPDGSTLVAPLDGDGQILVDWPFAPLESRDRASLRVRVSGADGWSSWSPSATVEASLLQPSDWSGSWITPVAVADTDDPAPLIGTTFEVGPDLIHARLHITALGIVVPHINGDRVSEDLFTPGWTTYDRLIRFRSYDVTALLSEGDNELSALIGNGWYRGRIASLPIHRGRVYGDRLGLLGQLELDYADGRRVTIGTDESWRTASSRILANDFYDGQTTDLRMPAWPTLHAPVERLDAEIGHLDLAVAPPVRELEAITPLALLDRSPAVIADFGRNLVGWVRMRVTAPAGTTVTIRHAEVLDGGELSIRPLRSAEATDRYVLAGEAGELLEPVFTYHGFRYAEIAGLPPGALIELEAVSLGSALTRTGWFECSDSALSQLHQNVVNSMVGNFLDVPTDCPQRDERLGWTGDIQVFAPTASTLFDVSAFLGGWLDSLALDQLPDGTVPAVVPRVFPKESALAGWGDAAVVVPWVLYQRYGDTGVLRRQYASMVAWVERVRTLAGPELLWRGGQQLGDWLDPLAPPDDPAAAQADPDVVATAYYFRSADLLSQSAAALGRSDDAQRYGALAARIRSAFSAAYVHDDGRITSDCQTVYALALAWEMIGDAAVRSRAGERLAELVESQCFTVATGFLGTPVVLLALSLAGRTDDAYRMLTTRAFPSWLYAVDLGATTIWERWDSLLADGSVNSGEMTSFNHYAFGAVANWMHRTIGGLVSLTPACRTVRVAPIPGAGLTSAAMGYDSPYGRIQVGWRLVEQRFELSLTVPVGVTATVELPDGTVRENVEHGSYEYAVETAVAAPAA